VLGRSPGPCGAAELLHAAHAEFRHHPVTWRSVGDRGDGEKTMGKAIEIDGLPIKMVIFHGKLSNNP